jgi:hypothetical protein
MADCTTGASSLYSCAREHNAGAEGQAAARELLRWEPSGFMRARLSLFLAAFPLAAQFSNLATDDTGSRVWFSSALRLRGTQQNLLPKNLHGRRAGQRAMGCASHVRRSLFDPHQSGCFRLWERTRLFAGYNCPVQVTCRVLKLRRRHLQAVLHNAGPCWLPDPGFGQQLSWLNAPRSES